MQSLLSGVYAGVFFLLKGFKPIPSLRIPESRGFNLKFGGVPLPCQPTPPNSLASKDPELKGYLLGPLEMDQTAKRKNKVRSGRL